ncbi:patatin-like phospholipase family protein [Nocardioides carbamazepini]|uniref:patatin-like phospholipase family protein n=1 Tax=Nocardioides carbamazepini TaxID=2854259 RepID=UPI00214A816A|nr:patatin-like phospholipase family protein [Nocardioides carbamazepini]MCR1782549.1 patatin-like phospholipase family protein [Nocardioides carbamazepini]
MGRALVIGCGGTLGFAWTAAVLAELERQGWDPRTADVLVGTSAGAELVALLGSGISAGAIHDGSDRLVATHLSSPRGPRALPGLPRSALPGLGLSRAALARRTDLLAGLAGLLPRGSGDAQWLVDLGDALTATGDTGRDWVAHPATWLVAADARSGERIPFGRADAPHAPLGQAIAASWAIPGWFPPVRIGDRAFLDGGTVSPTSADLLLPRVGDGSIDEVVVVAPMSSHGGAPARGLTRVERLLRRPMTRRVDREVAALRAAGARVVRIEPTLADLDAMGANFMDGSRVEHVRAAAARTTPTLVAQRLRDHPAPRRR